MNNFRHHHPKLFGGRGSELPNPWMTEEEVATFRRQNPQFHPVMPNLPPNIHLPLLNQGNMIPGLNKNFINQNSCKMPSSNFTRSPNPDIFKQSHLMNESNYPNRFIGNRFAHNSYSHANLQHKMNEGTAFKDFPTSNMMSHKSDGFSESVSKPLFSNVRQPQERFSCMQNDQAQLHSKYDNSRVFHEKGFPFSNDKELQSQNTAPFNDNVPVSVGSSFSYKSNYRAPNLFPAYTPKEEQEEAAKGAQHSGYNSDFVGKSNTFCDKTPVSSTFVGKSNICDKSSHPSTFPGKSNTFCDKSPVSTTYSKTIEPFQRKTETFQERNSEKFVNDLFPPNNTTTTFMYDKPPSKTVSNSQVSHDSYKTLEDPITVSNSKYPFPSQNQQSCFQSVSEIPFQKSQNMQVPNQPSSTASRDCLMQSVPFSSQSDVHPNMKESFSSFNFESNMNTTDIADLLPGLDAFLKENTQKPEEVLSKNDLSKSSGSNCAFSDDEWSKHSIPFIGENQTACENIQNSNIKDSYCDEMTYMKERFNDKSESKSERAAELQLPDINQPSSNTTVGGSVQKTPTVEKEAAKVRSTLQEAVEMLVKNDAIVGLDYIIEYKKNISHQGSFPFRCKLCNSAITRASIIDHILGSKHRMRYLKVKNESRYDYLISLKVEKSEKDSKIFQAAFEMEKMYGRGHVIVDVEEYQKDNDDDCSSKEIEGTVEPVFTLDKIPIGFEALSPQHEGMNTEFSLESNLNNGNQDTANVKKETENVPASIEVKKDVSCRLSSDSACKLPGLNNNISQNAKSDSTSTLLQTNLMSDVAKICNVNQEYDSNIELSSDLVCRTLKRTSSFGSTSCSKIHKTDSSEGSLLCPDIIDQKPPEIKSEDSSPETKEFNLDILGNLCKSDISSEEEASVVLQIINLLMEKFLRYKLQHLCLENVENLMKSLQTRSPDNIEDLSSLLRDSNIVKTKNEKTSVSLSKENKDSMQQKSNMILENNSERQMKQELSSHAEKRNLNVCELDSSMKNILDSNTSDPMLSNKASQPVPDVAVNNANFSASQNSGSVTLDNVPELSKNIIDINCMSQAAKSKASSSLGLKPPPFFSWSQTGEAITNQVSYATVQGSQNMMWTSPYQHTQTQYAQLPYYQSQNYGNSFTGLQAYQGQFSEAQFSVSPQKSTAVKIAQPPLPPPPPPPPPAPGDPPLPPLPSSPIHSSTGSSHSVPIRSTAPACRPLYSKQSSVRPPLP